MLLLNNWIRPRSDYHVKGFTLYYACHCCLSCVALYVINFHECYIHIWLFYPRCNEAWKITVKWFILLKNKYKQVQNLQIITSVAENHLEHSVLDKSNRKAVPDNSSWDSREEWLKWEKNLIWHVYIYIYIYVFIYLFLLQINAVKI